MSSFTDPRDPAVGDEAPAPDAATRIVYQALRALVPAQGTVAITDLTAVTGLDRATAAAAMHRLARTGPIAIDPRGATGEPAWLVTRSDRW